MQTGMVLYTRQGCHLCEAFLEEMQQHNPKLLKGLTQIDIDEDVTYHLQFNDKVPILFVNGTEICRYYFDADKIESCLKLQGYSLE